MAFKLYAVAKGSKPGIYKNWFGGGQAFEQIDGFKDARFKGFNDRGVAERWLRENSGMSQREYDKLVDKLIAGDKTVEAKLRQEAERMTSNKPPWE